MSYKISRHFVVSWVRELKRITKKNNPVVVITIVKTQGSSPAKEGAKLIVSSSKIEFGTIGGGKLEYQAIEDARNLLSQNEKTVYKEYPLGAAFGQCCGGKVDVFMEAINTEPKLYIFGAGHIGYALSEIMRHTVFDVKLIDSRENWFHTLQQNNDIEYLSIDDDEFEEAVLWGNNTYLIVLTHQHDLDQKIIEISIKNETKYVGLIGSKTKWKRFQDRIIRKTDNTTHLENVRCPVGIDIGAKTPQEIAISISAELLKTHYGK